MTKLLKCIGFEPSRSRKAVTIGMLLWLCLLQPLHAQVYKWVDETGKAHYSDSPPEHAKQKATAIQPATLGSHKPGIDWKSREQDFQRRRAQQNLAEKQQSEPNSRDMCINARGVIAQLNGKKVYRINNKGERVYMEDAERNALEQQAQKDIAQHCPR